MDEIDEEYITLQREILRTQGQNWFLNIHGWNDKNHSLSVCEWQGISCDAGRPNIVVGIDLAGYNIAGPISPTLGLLSSLMYINLSENYISGKIPKEFSDLPSLTSLRLNHNRISGKIPDFVSNKLEELNLSHNVLKGTIPGSIDKMINLQILDLGFNRLYGTIPSNVGNLKELKSLLLNENHLAGTIPPSLTRDDLSLVDLDLNHNDLSGTLPIGLANIRYLKNLHISGNKFTGAVPSSICNLNLNEEYFREDGNNGDQDESRDGCNSIACPMNTASKSGVHPCIECGNQGFEWYVGHVGRCLHLNEKILLDKIYEETNGPMWKEGSGWTLTTVDKCSYSGIECNGSGHVVTINLADHGLSGTIPQEFGMFRYLEKVDLSDNELTGFLPSDFRFLPLEYLDVSGNKLEGSPPPMLCLTGDINGNGNNGDYNCDVIACSAGTWSPIGRASSLSSNGDDTEQEYKCKPCTESHTHLGSRYCGGTVEMGSNGSGLIHLGGGEFVAALTLPLVGACAIVACITGVVLRRRNKHQSTTKDMGKEINIDKSSTKKTVDNESTRTAVIENAISTRSRMMNFNYNIDSDNDETDVLLRDIGTGLPYKKELEREDSLCSMKECQVDDEIQYPPSSSDIERTSFVGSSNGSNQDNLEAGMKDDENSSQSGSIAASTFSCKSKSSVGSKSSKGTLESKSSKGTSSRLSQNAEDWLDVPNL